jgi:hypothetical protein
MTPQFNSTLPTHIKSRCLNPAARILAAAASAMMLFFALAPYATAQTPTLIVVRGMPVHAKASENFPPQPALTKADIGEIKIGGKVVALTDFQPVLRGPHVLQLMVLLDSEQMLGAKGQFDDLKSFFKDMPPNVEIGVGWLLQSRVVVAQPFTTDRDLAGKALIAKTREEAANPKNDNGNPFSCLGNLAAHWPTPDPEKLRAVLIFTDGIIRSNAQPNSGDQVDPNILSAAGQLELASVIPYPFFWQDPIVPNPSRSEGGQLEGQDNFSQMDALSGGAGLFEGLFAPGSIAPLLNRLYATLSSEAVLTVADPDKPGKESRIDIKSTRDDIKIFSADQVVSGNKLGK